MTFLNNLKILKIVFENADVLWSNILNFQLFEDSLKEKEFLHVPYLKVGTLGILHTYAYMLAHTP